MKNTKFKLLIFMMGLVMMGSLMFTGCSGSKSVTQTDYQKDSTSLTTYVVERDTIINTEKTTVIEYVQVPCPDEKGVRKEFKPVLKKQNNATLSISMQPDNTLKAECECDTLAITAKLRDSYQTLFRQKESNSTTQLPPERYVPKWVRNLAIVGGGTIALCSYIAINKAIKIFA